MENKTNKVGQGVDIARKFLYVTQNALAIRSTTCYEDLKSQGKNCYRLSIAILYLRMHTLKTIAKTFGSTFKIIKFICIKSRVSLPYMTNCRW